MYKKILLLIAIAAFLCLSGNAQTKLTPTADSYTYLGGVNLGSNYGNETTLRTRHSKDDAYSRQTYIRFDLSGQASHFGSAKFYVYGKANSSKLVDVFSAFGDWTDTSLQGAARKKPSRQNYIGTIEVTNTYEYVNVDITEYINFAKATGRDNITIVLADREAQQATDEAYYHSKENTSGNTPYLLLTSASGTTDSTPKTYYVDADNGNDNGAGTSAQTAWKSLAQVESKFFNSGDKILFKRGNHFKGSAFFKIIPTSASITEVGAYGDGEMPIIDAEGSETYSLKFFNTPNLYINNLTITQTADDVPGIRRGLFYQGEDMGEIKNIHIDNVTIRDIIGNNGEDDGDLYAKRSAGLSLEITGNNIPTYMNGYLVENCYFYRVGRHGALNKSSWETRSLTTNTNWTPSLNVVYRRNVFEETASDGLIVRVAKAPLMEYNLLKRCSISLSGNACFTFNCDDAVWQYNEACYTVYNTGDVDAAGFDSDYKSKNTIFQYNYAHHNEYGDMLVTGGPANYGGFNDGTIVRYNVFYNNGHQGIRLSGVTTNTKIHNNIIYKDDNVAQPTEPYDEYTENRIFYHKNWGGWPANTTYSNNIYYYTHSSIYCKTDITTSSSLGSEFFNNIIYSDKIRSYPKQTDGLRLDPLFKPMTPVNDWMGLENMLNFQVSVTSPAINTGINIENSVQADYAGVTVPQDGKTDIGVFEYPSSMSVSIDTQDEEILKIKNPVVDGQLHFSISADDIENYNLEIYTIGGSLVKKITSTNTVNQKQIDVSHLPKGAYVLKLSGNNIKQSGIFLIA